jgi:hypothetical protein
VNGRAAVPGGVDSRKLPALPLEDWEATKNTLHLYCQVVGKVRLASTHRHNHWWNAPLYVTSRGLTTRRMARGTTFFEIDFDFLDHSLLLRTDRGEVRRLALHDGLSVAEFHTSLMAMLQEMGIAVSIRALPFGVPTTTPFSQDTDHAAYDADAVQRFWRVLLWTDWVLQEFAGWFSGKSSPVHLFWHSFDLAVSRFSGRRSPQRTGADPVTREAYSHEVISFGFWAGDARTRHAAFYSYTAPEPAALTQHVLRPSAASWTTGPTGSLALLPYDDVRTSGSPREALLSFLQSAYDAGAVAAGWDRDGFTTSWVPPLDQPMGRNG